MKKILLILIITSSIFSCKKEDTATKGGDTPGFLWQYNASNGDTAYVSPTAGSSFITINWRCMANGAKIIFDSVVVHADSSFTVNQKVQYFGTNSVVGSGNFGHGTLQFHFIMTPAGHAIFSGVKHP